MIRNTSPAPDKQTDSPKQRDKICSQRNNPIYTTYLSSYIHTCISADGPVLCRPHFLPFSVFCLLPFAFGTFFTLLFTFFF